MIAHPSESCTILVDAYDAIEPMVGSFIATAKVRTACRVAGLNVDAIACSETERFLAAFRKVCVQGVGGNITPAMLNKLACRCRILESKGPNLSIQEKTPHYRRDLPT